MAKTVLIDRFMKWIRKCCRKPKVYSVALGATGFAVLQDGVEAWSIQWEQIIEITAYKRDLLTTDLVCFVFQMEDKSGPWLVHEECEGFGELVESLEANLPGFDKWWRDSVIYPPFATNETRIYVRG